MKTKPIPATVMLIAGAITCIMNIVNHSTLDDALRTLLIVLVVFYLIGSVIKVILDKNIKMMTEDQKEETLQEADKKVENLEEQVENQENVQKDEESKKE